MLDHFAKCVDRSGENAVIRSFFIQRSVGMGVCSSTAYAAAKEKKKHGGIVSYLKYWFSFII